MHKNNTSTCFLNVMRFQNVGIHDSSQFPLYFLGRYSGVGLHFKFRVVPRLDCFLTSSQGI